MCLSGRFGGKRRKWQSMTGRNDKPCMYLQFISGVSRTVRDTAPAFVLPSLCDMRPVRQGNEDGRTGTRGARCGRHVLACFLMAGCAGVAVVPDDLEDQVDWNVSFGQMKAEPASYQGKLIVLGGALLSAKPLKQGDTRLEILQLPLNRQHEPIDRLTESEGRFLAFHKTFVDPATCRDAGHRGGRSHGADDVADRRS